MSVGFMVNRELRIIPKGWVHPTDGVKATGEPRYIGLLSRDYLSSGDGDDDEEPITEADCMPDVTGLRDDETEIAAYETTSDGTPMSPPFPNDGAGRLALVAWCTENATTFGPYKADGDTWAAILFGNTVAMTMSSGATEVRQVPS